jgi:hypothetical protein
MNSSTSAHIRQRNFKLTLVCWHFLQYLAHMAQFAQERGQMLINNLKELPT